MPFQGVRLGIPGSSPVVSILPAAMRAFPPDVYGNRKTNQVWLKATNTIIPSTSFTSVARNSPKMAVDSNGVWSSFGANLMARTTLGASYEDVRTNGISTSDMTGAVVADGVERTTNGSLALNPINANGWQTTNSGGTGNAVWNGTNLVTLTGGTNGEYFGSVALTTVPGLSYIVGADIGNTAGQFQAGTTAFAGDLSVQAASVGSGQKWQFIATTTTTFVTIKANSGTTVTVANFTVKSGGKFPNNWANFWVPSVGYAISVAALPVVNGIQCMDLVFSGTPTGNNFNGTCDNTSGITATYGQTWSNAWFLALIAGSFPVGFSMNIFTGEDNNTTFLGGAGVLNGVQALLTPTLQRFAGHRTVSAPTLNNVISFLNTGFTAGVPFNFTLRIGHTQLENNNVNSTVASAATNANGASGVNGTAVYSVGGGTGTPATLNVTWAAGVMTVNSVASAGNYTVFPPSPAALTYVSGTATGWTGATVNLTPTDNQAQGFATSPIITSSAPVTRALDVPTSAAGPFGSAYTIWARVTPNAPAAFTNNQWFGTASNGTNGSSFANIRFGGGATEGVVVNGAGGGMGDGAMSQNVSSKAAVAFVSAGTQRGACNGAAGAAVLGGTPASLTTLYHGTDGAGTTLTSLMGNEEEFAIWYNTALTTAQCQAITT